MDFRSFDNGCKQLYELRSMQEYGFCLMINNQEGHQNGYPLFIAWHYEVSPTVLVFLIFSVIYIVGTHWDCFIEATPSVPTKCLFNEYKVITYAFIYKLQSFQASFKNAIMNKCSCCLLHIWMILIHVNEFRIPWGVGGGEKEQN